MTNIKRPRINLEEFEQAFDKAILSESERKIIDYIRYIGTFTQPLLQKSLKLSSKPPVLSIMCNTCRKIGEQMPEHFEAVRKWSKDVSEHNVRWDGDLICSVAWTIDGEPLIPEHGNAQYHTFVVHKELFQGLE